MHCCTKTTERLQGKTNHLQSLDAQPTFFDIADTVSKIHEMIPDALNRYKKTVPLGQCDGCLEEA